MFPLMQTHSLHVFVLWGDECIMLHCFYKDSDATFYCHCQFLILLVRANKNVLYDMNAHKTEILMVSRPKICLFVFGHKSCYLFYFSGKPTLLPQQDYFVI